MNARFLYQPRGGASPGPAVDSAAGATVSELREPCVSVS